MADQRFPIGVVRSRNTGGAVMYTFLLFAMSLSNVVRAELPNGFKSNSNQSQVSIFKSVLEQKTGTYRIQNPIVGVSQNLLVSKTPPLKCNNRTYERYHLISTNSDVGAAPEIDTYALSQYLYRLTAFSSDYGDKLFRRVNLTFVFDEHGHVSRAASWSTAFDPLSADLLNVDSACEFIEKDWSAFSINDEGLIKELKDRYEVSISEGLLLKFWKDHEAVEVKSSGGKWIFVR